MADSKKYDGSTWEHSLRKMTTATAEIEPTIYTDGTAITSYTIKGNTVQNGTPTPSNPVPVVGVGELETTGEHSGEYKIPISTLQGSAVNYLGSVQTTRQIQKLVLTGQENWEYQSLYSRFVTELTNVAITGLRYTPFLCTHYQPISDGRAIENVPNNAAYLALTGTATGTLNIKTDAFTSETAFSEYLATQYAAGTPVTVWFVMYNAQTAAINEPLMAITTNDSVVHADTLSNAVSIPTTEGANSITVDTTVQPSEFTATWTGWHDSSVKEYDGTDWQ